MKWIHQFTQFIPRSLTSLTHEQRVAYYIITESVQTLIVTSVAIQYPNPEVVQ